MRASSLKTLVSTQSDVRCSAPTYLRILNGWMRARKAQKMLCLDTCSLHSIYQSEINKTFPDTGGRHWKRFGTSGEKSGGRRFSSLKCFECFSDFPICWPLYSKNVVLSIRNCRGMGHGMGQRGFPLSSKIISELINQKSKKKS